MKITIEITEDEAYVIGYALRELAYRRAEQSIERSEFAQQEASRFNELSNRIYHAAKNSCNEA